MKKHLYILAIAAVLLPHLVYSAEKTEPRFSNTEIIITIADATNTINVAKNNGILKPGNTKVYQSGFERTDDGKSKGNVSYKFIKQTSKGDLYTFTITHPGAKSETINYIYSGIGDRFYGKDGITITIQEKAG